eukprot:6615053-Prymnesium_polylepis.1
MNSTVRLLALVARRRFMTLLTVAGLLSRVLLLMELCDRKPPFGVRTQVSIGVTSISRTDNAPTVWRTADGHMGS